MREDLAEVCTLLGHAPRSRLAEPNAVSVAGSLQNELLSFLLHDEIIAQNGIPA